MPRFTTVMIGLALFSLGYLIGMDSSGSTQRAVAQAPDDDQNLSQNSLDKLRETFIMLQQSSEALKSEGRYQGISEGLNGFLILSGGGDAMADLESGNGVDPETFAALYAGAAIPEVQDHLATDADGHVTYKGEVVRMYSVSRLKELYARRMKFADTSL